MPRSISSFYDTASRDSTEEGQEERPQEEVEGQESRESDPASRDGVLKRSQSAPYTSHAPQGLRATSSAYDIHEQDSSRVQPLDESSSLLGNRDGVFQSYTSFPSTPRPFTYRQKNYKTPGSFKAARHHSRRGSWSMRLVQALDEEQRGTESSMQASRQHDERVWYDQFTSTDWVHDNIADAYRLKALRSRKDFKGKLLARLDGAQGWILVAIIGCLTAFVAYCVTVTETALFDYKFGYCDTGWHLSRRKCCSGASDCDDWVPWSEVIRATSTSNDTIEYLIFIVAVMVLAGCSCLLTLLSKTVIPSAISLSTLDENLGADPMSASTTDEDNKQNLTPNQRYEQVQLRAPMVYYSAAGSGVAEIKVIVSGFVLHGYLGFKTLTIKSFALILSVASGMSLGKEGPYVHIATCVGNICARMFAKYNSNDGKRREVLSAASAAGVAVAFGAPIGGVLFSLEEVSYYFPPKTLFRTFFCCIAAALSLKFLNPYGTGKIVLFEVRYMIDWKFFEIIAFILTGIIGGFLGALFIKASRFWARTFRRIPAIRQHPLIEVLLVALVTGMISYWNRFTKLPVTELLFELSSPCDAFTRSGDGLCPTKEQIPDVIGYLAAAFVIKAFLTIITFGIKVPAGIYVPSMVVGGIMGRIVGLIVQYLALNYSHTGLFGRCAPDAAPESCVVPGVYAMVAAGATMCGVTRLSVTLAVILFELTGSLDHVLPFCLGVLAAKWTADALEPLSIYDLLTDMNSYPFLDNKARPIFTNTLSDITSHHVRQSHIIDISSSPLVLATQLREKLDTLHFSGELDSGLPILRNGILVGLIPAPDLEFALDKLEGREEDCLCLMSPRVGWADRAENNDGTRDEDTYRDRTDFTPYIDPAPVSLDIHSPMDLVYECFVKLGLRYVCVLKDGRYAGLVHKKRFVAFCKEIEAHGN